MSLRDLLHIPRKALLAVLYVALVALLLFFGLTRTEVGRDELRRQVEAQFDARFEGRLQIDRLSGNLLHRLAAGGVRILDDQGRVVLSADSAVIHPTWRDLFRRTVTARRIVLIRPEVHLVRGVDGRWNIQEAFRSRGPATGARPWALSFADVTVVDGRVTTRHEGPPPAPVADGLLFNYADTRVEHVQAHAVLEWRAGSRLIDVRRLRGDLPGLPFDLTALQGQMVMEDDVLALNDLVLTAGETTLQLTGSLTRAGDAPAVDLDLRPSRLAFHELRAAFHALPLDDAAVVSARVHGPLGRLVVEQLTAERGASTLTAEGTLLGLPDSLDYDVAVPAARLREADVRALLPRTPRPSLARLGDVRLEAQAQGVVQWAGRDTLALEATSRFALQSAAGRLQGEVYVDRRRPTPVTYRADLQAGDLDLGRLLPGGGWPSHLNGRLQADGRGLAADAVTGTLSLALAPSHLHGRMLDTLRLDLTAQEGRLEGTGFARQAGGVLALEAWLDLQAARPSYRLTASMDGLDLGPLLRNDSLTTRLHSTLALTGTGRTLQTLQGEAEVTFDSSLVHLHGQTRVLPPNRLRLTLDQLGEASPRLRLQGDVASVELTGDVALAPLVDLGRLWGHALTSAARQTLAKPYRPAGAQQPAVLQEDDLTGWVHESLYRAAARRSLADAGLEQQSLQVHARLLRADLLTALLPVLPPLAADLEAHLRMTADADRFELHGRVVGDSVRAGTFRADTVQVELQAAGALDAPLVQTLRASLDAEARRMHVAGQPLPATSLTLQYERETGTLALHTRPADGPAPFRLAARLDLLPDRNRLTLTDLFLAAEDYAWTIATESRVDVYAQAAVVSDLVLENRSAGDDAVQRIWVDGTLSAAPQDTLFVGADDILLRQLSRLGRLRYPLGGRMNGRIALTGVMRQPEITGDLQVSTLSFDDRLLGQLTVSSRYVPGRPDVTLEADLRPIPADTALTYLPGTRTPARLTPSRLQLGGTFRLPQVNARGEMVDPGALSLTADIDHADAFFFAYLFREVVADVEGRLAGRGTIRGTFQRPRFDADVALSEAHFRVPEFNLNYQARGTVQVDDQGIWIRNGLVQDPTGGTAEVSGGILFNDYRYFSFDLRAALDQLQIMNVLQANHLAFYGQIWASGTTTLSGPISATTLRSTDAVTSPRSSVFIPITDETGTTDAGFIVFADSTGRIPDLGRIDRRENLLAQRPAGERLFLDGLAMDLNIFAPAGTTVNLVIDPLLGDVIHANGSGRIQLQRSEGEFFTYGALDVTSGDYLFTAGEVFYRRFLIDAGRLLWDGDPLNALLDIQASYRTRASTAGLNLPQNHQRLIPMVVRLGVTGRVTAPVVDLALAVDRDDRSLNAGYEGLEVELNQPDRAAQYATSVLLTNSFLLTTDLAGSAEGGTGGSTRAQLADTGNQLAFNSLSQLVASQLNRYINQALPNVDLNFGVQGESTQDLDVTYGVALRLLDERLIIRGQGIYQNDPTQSDARRTQQSLLDEFVVEIHLNPRVSVEVFYRREGDLLTDEPLTNTTGAGLSYETQFSTWDRLFERIRNWFRAAPPEDPPPPEEQVADRPG